MTTASQQEIEFFLNASSKVVELELFEISHPSFTQTYRFVRNALKGITLPNSDFFQYYPAKVKKQTSENNLDYGVKVFLGDMSEVLPPEVRRLRTENALSTKPVLNYWIYRSDNLDTPLKELGPLLLDDYSFDNSNSYFIAKAPSLNNTKTGKTYNFEDFSSLESFL